jgi:hypothetical protein
VSTHENRTNLDDAREQQIVAVLARVRAACLDAAITAYDDAGIRGLCAEGRWEAAVGAIRRLNLSNVFEHAGKSALPAD